MGAGAEAKRGAWVPRCARPAGLVRARAVGRDGADGLTWRVASGPRWERVGRGLYVPRDRPTCVEQRILDAGARLAFPGERPHGVVTGWAALRWRGAAYFDGQGDRGSEPRPVELLLPGTGRNLGPRDGVVVRRRNVGRDESEMLDGLAVATPQRALFDEVRTRGELWSAVQAIDMAAAAGLISVWLFGCYLAECNSMNGIPLAREAASLAVDESLSPREPWLRLVWVLEAGLPTPLVNVPVYDRGGRLLGVPDLLDPEAGMVIEYSGEVHRSRERHRKDVEREARFRDHGLEYAEVVAGDTREVVARRLLSVRARARFLAPQDRRWTLDPPAWVTPPETLDARLDRLGLAEALSHH